MDIEQQTTVSYLTDGYYLDSTVNAHNYVVSRRNGLKPQYLSIKQVTLHIMPDKKVLQNACTQPTQCKYYAIPADVCYYRQAITTTSRQEYNQEHNYMCTNALHCILKFKNITSVFGRTTVRNPITQPNCMKCQRIQFTLFTSVWQNKTRHLLSRLLSPPTMQAYSLGYR